VAEEPIDGQAGWHRQVAADAFNRAWELIELDTRTPEQDRQLLALVFTSRYHWGWVGGDEEAMVGDWLIAHVASLQDLGELSHRYATVALDVCRSNGWSDWRLASMLEGMARASAAVGDEHARDRYAAEARRVLATLEDKEDRELIASQLASIPGLSPA
jgi:hypothetical protein